jgi:hypothetical protein
MFMACVVIKDYNIYEDVFINMLELQLNIYQREEFVGVNMKNVERQKVRKCKVELKSQGVGAR